LARTPPLGFNTWNSFACGGINADVLIKTADLMVSSGLAAAGFEYVNMDDVSDLYAQRSDSSTDLSVVVLDGSGAC
jgi:alpha-galactosidase